MAKPQTLNAQERARTGSGVLKQMRREGFIPSVIYGGKVENKNVKVHGKTFKNLLHQAASDSILVNLELEGESTQLAFLQDVQHDALSGEILHVDFLAVDQNTEINAQLPLELTGESEGVKHGGVLEQMLHNLEVRCLPKDLPELISADITPLEIGDALHIGEVSFPEGVSPTLAEDVVVALVAAARVELPEEEEEGEGEEESEGEGEAQSHEGEEKQEEEK